MDLAALKGDPTANEVAIVHGAPPTLVSEWKRQMLTNAGAIFDQAPLFEKTGRLGSSTARAGRLTANGCRG